MSGELYGISMPRKWPVVPADAAPYQALPDVKYKDSPTMLTQAEIDDRREALAQRMRELVDDAEHWNRTHPDEPPIIIDPDVTKDVAELMALGTVTGHDQDMTVIEFPSAVARVRMDPAPTVGNRVRRVETAEGDRFEVVDG